jgi:hypothetical protein
MIHNIAVLITAPAWFLPWPQGSQPLPSFRVCGCTHKKQEIPPTEPKSSNNYRRILGLGVEFKLMILNSGLHAAKVF